MGLLGLPLLWWSYPSLPACDKSAIAFVRLYHWYPQCFDVVKACYPSVILLTPFIYLYVSGKEEA